MARIPEGTAPTHSGMHSGPTAPAGILAPASPTVAAPRAVVVAWSSSGSGATRMSSPDAAAMHTPLSSAMYSTPTTTDRAGSAGSSSASAPSPPPPTSRDIRRNGRDASPPPESLPMWMPYRLHALVTTYTTRVWAS